MRVWLAGSRAFGKEVFEHLLAESGIIVIAVTAPESDALWDSATGKVACCHEVYSHWVRDYHVDLIISAQNYKHISKEARDAAKWGAIGYHPSLLPRHRGRNSVTDTIKAGDGIAGGTVYQMDDGWDTGPIIAQAACHVKEGWNGKDLWKNELFPMGVRLLKQVLREGPPWDSISQDSVVLDREMLTDVN